MAAPTGAIQNFNSYNSARECTRDYQQFHRSGYGKNDYPKRNNELLRGSSRKPDEVAAAKTTIANLNPNSPMAIGGLYALNINTFSLSPTKLSGLQNGTSFSHT